MLVNLLKIVVNMVVAVGCVVWYEHPAWKLPQWDQCNQNVRIEEEKVYSESTAHTSTRDISKNGMYDHYHEEAVPLDKESEFEAKECLQLLVDIPQRSKYHSRKNN